MKLTNFSIKRKAIGGLGSNFPKLILGLLFCLFVTQVEAQWYYFGVDGGTISTDDDTTICVDGTADVIEANVKRPRGRARRWVITNSEGIILDVKRMRTFSADFDGAGGGTCFIYNVSFNYIRGLRKGRSIKNLRGRFDLSNSIEVVRNEPQGGTIEGGPFEFVVDGQPDFATGIQLTGNQGGNSQWVITDEVGTILGLPPSPDVVNFDDAGVGVCLIWHLSFEDGLSGAIAGNNATTDLAGCYSLSNPIRVVRNADTNPVEGGTITGGPFEFCVDGEADFATGIELSGNTGSNSLWIITDDTGTILGTPPSPDVVNFDDAGAGTCFIYHASFDGVLEGAVPGSNVNTGLSGDFALSNSIAVVRNEPQGGTIEGGPFEFVVDGQPDFATGIQLTGNQGGNSQWVITDEVGTILGLPPSPDVVNFDDAGVGVCLIWHLSFEDGLSGAIAGNNATTDLAGCYSLSNPIRVVRNADTNPVEGGTITGGPFEFCVDGEADFATGIELSGNTGSNSLWIITDDTGTILGTPPSPDAVNFDDAGAGTCFIYHASFDGVLEGAVPGSNVNTGLSGDFALSNSLRVGRTDCSSNPVDGGEISAGRLEFCVGNGESDTIGTLSIGGDQGDNSQWLITNEAGDILDMPFSPLSVDFDNAGVGICLIYHLSFQDGLDGLAIGNNVNTDLTGIFDLSNALRVVRTECDFEPLSAGFFINPMTNELSVTVTGGNAVTELFVNFINFGGGNVGSSATEIFSSEDGSAVTYIIDTSDIPSGAFIARLIEARTFRQLAAMTYTNN